MTREQPRYRVLPLRGGIRYGHAYFKTLEGAVRHAQTRGWYGDGEHQLADPRPMRCEIAARVDRDRWETVAVVTKDGIAAVPAYERASVRSAKLREDQAAIESAEADGLEEELRCAKRHALCEKWARADAERRQKAEEE